MRKMILGLGIALLGTTAMKTTTAVSAKTKTTTAGTHTKAIAANDPAAIMYKQINFGKNPVSFEAFSTAYKGYMNLKKEGKLNTGKDIISICDFSLVSTAKRLWVIDLAQKKVLFNAHVTHGQGSGMAYATAFSNTNNSHQTSLGFYVTGTTYAGKYGKSMRLSGMDKGYNDAAYARAVVMHAAPYASESFVKQTNTLGRSWGCPAVAPELVQPIINTIKDGTCLFIYAKKADYLQASYWLKNQPATATA